MTSSIDPTVPQTGIDQPVILIRNNFARAKIEIEDLQATKLDITGGQLTGVINLTALSNIDLPTPTTKLGGLAYSNDDKSLIFCTGSEWVSVAKNLVDLSDVSITSADATVDGYVLTWDNSHKKYVLAPQVSLSEQNFYINTTFNAKPVASEVMLRYPIPVGITLPVTPLNSAQHRAVVETSPTSTTIFTIHKVSGSTYTQIGTITFSAGTAPISGTIVISNTTTFIVGDFLLVRAPATPDATLAGFGCTLSAYIT